MISSACKLELLQAATSKQQIRQGDTDLQNSRFTRELLCRKFIKKEGALSADELFKERDLWA